MSNIKSNPSAISSNYSIRDSIEKNKGCLIDVNLESDESPRENTFLSDRQPITEKAISSVAKNLKSD